MLLTLTMSRSTMACTWSPSCYSKLPDNLHSNEYSERYFNSYKERDVEWRAWEVHGGPIEYWKL